MAQKRNQEESIEYLGALGYDVVASVALTGLKRGSLDVDGALHQIYLGIVFRQSC
jgi:hypothetical protein